MITRLTVADKLLGYLNHQLSLAQLVDWAEKVLIDTPFESEEDIPLLTDVLAYLAAGDTPDFPLTWEVLSGFLDKLGVSVKVMAA